MYLREALRCCRDLEAEVGQIYDELAAQHATDLELKALWTELAQDERRHSRIVTALLAAEDVQEDDGPFVVDLRPRIDRLRKLLHRAYKSVRAGIEPAAAIELATFIEGTEINELFREVVELGRPSLLRLLGQLERGIDGGDPHFERLQRWTAACASAAPRCRSS